MRKINKSLIVCFSLLLAISKYTIGQDYSTHSFKVAAGLGFNEGPKEMGMGPMLILGYQKSFWKDRCRLSPHIIATGFFPFGVTDTRDQYYRITLLGVNGYLDFIKKDFASLFIGGGGFVNYTRGLLGTGGFPEAGNNQSDYYFKIYYGGYAGAGLRITPKNSRVAYELTPVNVYFGNDYFVLGFFKFGVDIKLKERTK
jgi:hypothetical protein